ncbi:MAG: GNAT family N-acetyltransferase [Myxococcales bacterium]|nr:GNAT family N-acetyltransferase [Myxococcales bacterium]MCB9546355.1 GNAT family N-acetyltransferase [Myxococcales bacterium]
MPLPPFVVRSAAVPETEGAYPAPFDDEKLSLGRDLGTAAGSRRLGAWRERLLPGRRTSFTHAHVREEELLYVLAGRPSLRWIEPGQEAQEVELQPGDFVSFPAGTGVAHCVWNRADVEAELLVVGERHTSERTHYPEEPLFEAWRDDARPHRAWPDPVRPVGDARWPAARIETERLIIRPWEPADAWDLWALREANREHVGRWLAWGRETADVDEVLSDIRGYQVRFAERRDLVYGVFLGDHQPIGGIGLHKRVGPEGLEIGYWIDHAHEGRGFVTEASAALCTLVFEVRRLKLVEIHCEPDNVRSAAVPLRLGFTRTGTLPARHVNAAGDAVPSAVFSLLAHEWQSDRPLKAWDSLGRRLY